MSALRLTYLALAIWGAVHPMYYFIGFWNENGYSLSLLVDSWYVNRGTEGLVWDLTIAAIALTVWVIAETIVRRNWVALLAIPATFGVGLSFGLPLYLFLRTAPVKGPEL